MGTKINEAYYGAAADWVSVSTYSNKIKCATQTLAQMGANGKWDVANDGMFDMSAVPWGMPHCSISAMATPLFASTNKGGTNYGGNFTPVFAESEIKNVPLILQGYNTSGTSSPSYTTTGLKAIQKKRYVGQTEYNSGFKSTNTVDSGENVGESNTNNNRIITYLDYQAVKVALSKVYLYNENISGANANNCVFPVNFDDLAYYNPDDPDSFYLAAFTSVFCVDTNSNVFFCPNINTLYDVPPNLNKRYFGNAAQKWYQAQRNIYSRIGTYTSSTQIENTLSKTLVTTESFDEAQTADFHAERISTAFKNCSAKKQVFDDVSYHWEQVIRYGDAYHASTIKTGGLIPASAAGSVAIQCICRMVLDDYQDDGTPYARFRAYQNAILHELAFLGFPIVGSTDDLSLSIGNDRVYLPVFDTEHMITTGNFTNGIASLVLPNATWGDIFDDSMPVYDPEYQPEQPDLWILPQRPLIHVYGEKTTNFNTNGYAIIEPISCEVYHEENGEYSAQFETYCDEYGKFTYLHKQAQVKIPIRYHGEISWQIFRVMNTHRIMNADGTYRIRALAYHKFYDNNNFLIKSAHPTGMSGITALPYICTHSLYNSQIYPFEASSDITAGKTAYYDKLSITNALLGADQCFVNRWGGKLYRDNLYFSINDEMEYSKSAGVISYAYNLTDIDFEEDDTELITDLIAEDNFGNSYHIGVPDSELRVPNRIYAYRSFYYDEEDVQAFHADAAAYLDEYKQSVVNITVNFLNLSELDKYKEFQQLDAYEVGDRVIIYHKDLDIYYSHLEIISKRYDVVKRRTVEIQIGDFKNAITQRAYMSDTTSDGQTAQDKMNAQLFAQDTKIMSLSISGMETFDIFALEKRTINELEGR